MTDASFASLSPRLLARKGGAKPAMRSQLGMFGGAEAGATEESLEDLGWNDMGDDTSAITPATPPSAEVIAINTGRRQDIGPLADTGPAAPAPQSKGDRSAFTLRLDAERHLKLRLACTVRACSAQQLVTDALDALLGQMPDIQQLAAQVGRT